MKNIPEKNLEPPVKRAKVGVCPNCGYEHIQAKYSAKKYMWIDEWDGDKPDEFSDASEEDFNFLSYYCPVCDTLFDTPVFVEAKE